MKVPTFRVELAEEAKEKTLAEVPEWTLAECCYDGETLMRFRVGDFAYSTPIVGRSPMKQAETNEYTAKKVIGQIVCE